ncbi:MAG: radical SAM protein [Anaerolineaceae bacterium]|nr:radical SAM protein [Anaerolineaceae bacterium]
MAFSFWPKGLLREKYNKLPDAGIYHFDQQKEHSKNRIHLRVEEDGNGLLLVNAARAYHLNPSAVAMAFWSLSGRSETEIMTALKKNFEIGHNQLVEDASSFLSQMAVITDPDEGCPMCELDLDMDLPFSHTPSSPYRMDIAITYQCNNDCTHCYNARSRQFPQLSKDKWFKVIDKIWKLNIPHIVFTGGEPTLYDGLPDLIQYAENKGIITGINTNGRKLADEEFLSKLISAGLDHIQITLESSDAVIHDKMVNLPGAWIETIAGIKNVLKHNVYMMTNTTMLKDNYLNVTDTLDFLAELGVPTVGLNALIYSGKGKDVGTGLSETQLAPLLEIAKEKTQKNSQKLIWYTPTHYCRFNPITHDLGVKGCSAALYNMCIEPNGDVLPCQSYYYPLGNILTNTWDSIWNHKLSKQLRERKNLPQKCNHCELIQECGGGCPLSH